MLYNDNGRQLVRDKIPKIIENSGKKAVIEVLDSQAYKKYMDKKLGEELQEYLEADSVEELADMIEVVCAIIEYKSIDIKSFENIRNKKAAERGAFDKRLLLKEVIEEKGS